jgi:hypothetical protein
MPEPQQFSNSIAHQLTQLTVKVTLFLWLFLLLDHEHEGDFERLSTDYTELNPR